LAITAAAIQAVVSVVGADKSKADIKSVSDSVNETSQRLASFAGGVALAAGAAFVGIGVASTKMAADFQTGMASLVTGAGESASNIKSVSDGILQMAVDTGTSTSQLTSGMYMIESAGYHGADGLNVLKIAAEGAKVGNADLGTTANAVTTILTDYHLKSTDAAGAMNALVTTVASGKTHLQDLANSMGAVLPLASSLGVSFPQVGGAIATMTNAGMSAQNASQNLANAMRALAAPNKVASSSLIDVGLSAKKVSDDLSNKGLAFTIQEITDAVGKKFPAGGEAAKAALKNIMGGATGLNVALMLGNANMSTFTSNVDSISKAMNAGGTSVQGWADVQGTFNFKLDQAREIVETLGIKLGTALLPILGKLLDQIMPIITQTGNWIIKSGIMQDAANNLVTGLKKFSDTITNITTYLGKHNDALNLAKIGALALAGAVVGVMTPGIIAATVSFLALDVAALPWIALAGAIGAVVALLVVGFINLYNNSKPVRDFFASMGPVFSGVGAIFKQIWDIIVSSFAPAWKDLTKAFNDSMPALKVIGEILLGVLLVAIGLVIGVVAGLALGIGMAVAGIVQVFTGLVEILNGIFKIIGGIFLFLMDLITGRFSNLGNDLKLIWDGIVGILKGAWDIIVGVFKAAVGLVGGIIGGFWIAIVKYFTDLYDKLVGHSIIPDMINGIVSWFAQLPGRVGKWVIDMYNTVVDWFSKLPGKIAGFWDTIKTDIGNAWKWIQDTITSKAEGIFNNIMKPFNSARDAIGGVVRSFVNNSIDVFNNGLSGIETFINLFGTGINSIAHALGAGDPVGHIPVGRIPHYATGTDAHPGGPAIVGEKGRELVFLPKGAKVAPNSVTEQLLAGGKIPGYAGGIGDIASSIMGWIGGGAKSILDNVMNAMNIHLTLPGQLSGIASGLVNKVKDWAVSWIDKIMPKFGGLGPDGTPVNIPGNVASWIATAMGLTGTPAIWGPDLGIIAMDESGGNPNAINLTDSNALAGHPSQGLFQTIPSTFAAYALPGHGNIDNPVDNSAAAIGYIKSRYGDVFHVPGILSLASGKSYVGYANGTNYAPGGMAVVGERGPELMYVPKGSRITPNSQLNSVLQGGTVVHVHNYIDGREMTDVIGSRLVKSARTTGPIRSGL